MKIVKINESQRRRLFEAYTEGFSFENLSIMGAGFGDNDGSDNQYKYCCHYLGEPVGKGTSRVIFTLGDNTVLKLAYGKRDAGIAQNRNERWLFEKTKSPILARVYASDEDGFTWLVSESVLPARPEDFEKVFGIPYTSEYKQKSIPMKRGFDDNKGDIDIGFDKYFDNIKYYGELREDEVNIRNIFGYMTDKIIKKRGYFNPRLTEVIRNSEWLKELGNLMSKTEICDVVNMNNYGIVNREGKEQIVILDSGFNLNVGAKYY